MWAEPLCGLRSWTKKSQNPSLCFLTRDTRLPPQLSADPTIMPPPFSEKKKTLSLFAPSHVFSFSSGKSIDNASPNKISNSKKRWQSI